jgi:hypothetical protein
VCGEHFESVPANECVCVLIERETEREKILDKDLNKTKEIFPKSLLSPTKSFVNFKTMCPGVNLINIPHNILTAISKLDRFIIKNYFSVH